MSVGTDLLNAPFPEMVKTLGLGIAEAQYELDLVSMKIARMMAGYQPDEEPEDGSAATATTSHPERTLLVPLGDGHQYSLLELGFTPNFYQFVDTMIELKMSISMSRETNISRSSTTVNASVAGGGFAFFGAATMRVSTVSASYASKYQYSAEGSSLMRTKLVPVPAPALLEERIRAMIAASSPAPGG
ncbi:hypothetical protein [endosymbiont of Ridgeia piscesae]|jgi:hypothetical protein|uniref:Uncharacterized protein n=1 Tax=endosymbiont of Ridgeia piscesae TaxID=54398 RepID=A0A0T5Z1W9_9GAMM|nr:hypothetical protein [endosymbiont of Ridgeia piscesae]KRT55860.1 hypothetical protein Ga0074115_1269 [endosymbiont of Ridgeia piscesae]KRT56803.1 hypothetical protein Ga0076813_10298 [endosymbiont of Ridgeia piscesae]